MKQQPSREKRGTGPLPLIEHRTRAERHMYQVTNGQNVLEEHHKLVDAEIAFWTLTAHELKKGRRASLRLDDRSRHEVTAPSKLLLPAWVKEVLREHGME